MFLWQAGEAQALKESPSLILLLEPWNKTREVQHGAYLDGAIHRATDKSVSIEI